MNSKALLLVMMEPPSMLEDEFNDWYDTEHFPQRMAMPGFVSGSRWVCTDGWPRWMAYYDLESIDALNTPEYLTVSGSNSTSWSKRLLPKTIGRQRVVATSISTSKTQVDSALVSRMLVACYAGLTDANLVCEALLSRLAGHSGVVDARGFVEVSRECNDLWLLVRFDGPLSLSSLHDSIGRVQERGARVFNIYAPYNRQ